MDITIYTIAWNERLLLPFFHQFYSERFPTAKFVIYDNESTDGTPKLAKELGMEVRSYSTDNKLSDAKYLEIKNNCWKESKGWVIVCDTDEWLDINEKALKLYAGQGGNIFQAIGYNMCNVQGTQNLLSIDCGIRASNYDKVILFYAGQLQEINYYPGCHQCNPKGNLSPSFFRPTLLHMKFINEQYMVDRYKQFSERLSEENRSNGWGFHYDFPEEKLRLDYQNHIQAAKKINI